MQNRSSRLFLSSGLFSSSHFLYTIYFLFLLAGNDTLALPGGPLPELVGEPAPNFTRGVSGGASSVPELPVGWTPDADAIPPSKITDLTVFNTSFDEGLVHVKFTAPGDDLDFGSGKDNFTLNGI